VKLHEAILAYLFGVHSKNVAYYCVRKLHSYLVSRMRVKNLIKSGDDIDLYIQGVTIIVSKLQTLKAVTSFYKDINFMLCRTFFDHSSVSL